ncbi:MAG: phosphotransferase [Patescibacteria group bacterium]
MSKSFRSEKKRRATLTRKERRAVLSSDSSFESVIRATYFDNYDLPCPVRVDIATKGKKIRSVVLRRSRHGSIKKEAQIFKALSEFGLPVPEVLKEPFKNEKGEWVAVYSLLPGENLQKLSMGSKKDLALAKRLVVEAVLKLSKATRFINKHKVSRLLPRHTLVSELKAVSEPDNPWISEEIFKSTKKYLDGVIPKIKTPLILSNGDYQPGNFLEQNGKLTGFLDFESPSFSDPLMGFVKYPIYDLYPLGRTNIVEVFLKKAGFSKKDFKIRLALGCLKVLKKEIPISGGNTEMKKYRNRVLRLIKEIVY